MPSSASVVPGAPPVVGRSLRRVRERNAAAEPGQLVQPAAADPHAGQREQHRRADRRAGQHRPRLAHGQHHAHRGDLPADHLQRGEPLARTPGHGRDDVRFVGGASDGRDRRGARRPGGGVSSSGRVRRSASDSSWGIGRAAGTAAGRPPRSAAGARRSSPARPSGWPRRWFAACWPALAAAFTAERPPVTSCHQRRYGAPLGTGPAAEVPRVPSRPVPASAARRTLWAATVLCRGPRSASGTLGFDDMRVLVVEDDEDLRISVSRRAGRGRPGRVGGGRPDDRGRPLRQQPVRLRGLRPDAARRRRHRLRAAPAAGPAGACPCCS